MKTKIIFTGITRSKFGGEFGLCKFLQDFLAKLVLLENTGWTHILSKDLQETHPKPAFGAPSSTSSLCELSPKGDRNKYIEST